MLIVAVVFVAGTQYFFSYSKSLMEDEASSQGNLGQVKIQYAEKQSDNILIYVYNSGNYIQYFSQVVLTQNISGQKLECRSNEIYSLPSQQSSVLTFVCPQFINLNLFSFSYVLNKFHRQQVLSLR